MTVQELLARKVTILSPMDKKTTLAEVACAIRPMFAGVCCEVRRLLNIACEDESLLVILLATYTTDPNRPEPLAAALGNINKINKELLAAAKLALHALSVARENVADAGGTDCQEALFFDQPIRVLRAALAKAGGA